MSRRHRAAFSMTSMLVFLGLILLFLAMLFPIIARVRTQAGAVQSMNNLRQMGIGVHAFHDVQQFLPPAVGNSRAATGTVHFHILPYLEQEPLYRQGQKDWTKVADQRVPIFLAPEDRNAPPGNVHQGWLALTNYAGNWMVLRDGDMKLTNIPDGTSNTILFTTRYQLCNEEPTAWAYNRLHYKAPMFNFYSRARFQLAPADGICDPGLPQGFSNAGIVVLMGDASARTVAPWCSPQTWSFASDPSDGMTVANDFER